MKRIFNIILSLFCVLLFSSCSKYEEEHIDYEDLFSFTTREGFLPEVKANHPISKTTLLNKLGHYGWQETKRQLMDNDGNWEECTIGDTALRFALVSDEEMVMYIFKEKGYFFQTVSYDETANNLNYRTVVYIGNNFYITAHGDVDNKVLVRTYSRVSKHEVKQWKDACPTNLALIPE